MRDDRRQADGRDRHRDLAIMMGLVVSTLLVIGLLVAAGVALVQELGIAAASVGRLARHGRLPGSDPTTTQRV